MWLHAFVLQQAILKCDALKHLQISFWFSSFFFPDSDVAYSRISAFCQNAVYSTQKKNPNMDVIGATVYVLSVHYVNPKSKQFKNKD